MYTYPHGCARAKNSLEPISPTFSTGADKAVPTVPPTNTSKIRQTTDDDDDDFVHGIIGGAIVLGMILMIYACHSCYLRFCRNRQDNAGPILNLPNMVQLPSQFPIGSSYLHKDDGITLVNQDWTTLLSDRGNAVRKEEKVFFAATGWLGVRCRQTFDLFFVCLFFLFVSLFY